MIYLILGILLWVNVSKLLISDINRKYDVIDDWEILPAWQKLLAIVFVPFLYPIIEFLV